jgi:hypothetical protein
MADLRLDCGWIRYSGLGTIENSLADGQASWCPVMRSRFEVDITIPHSRLRMVY